MTGIFTYRNFSLQDTPDLDGRVAVVTVEITAQLLEHGIAKVFLVARSATKYQEALQAWKQRHLLDEDNSRVTFVPCDLGDINAVKAAADQIKQSTEYVHILVCNAALGVPPQYKRSSQNIDWVFATNCVGHQVLTMLLVPLLKRAVTHTNNGDARVVVTSSVLHVVCRHLDLDLLTSPSRIIKWSDMWDGIWRYGRSKLGNILFANELSRRLLLDRDPAAQHIYVNSYFPGNIVTDQWTAWSAYVGGFLGWILRKLAGFFGQNLQDGAATAVYLAASQEVRQNSYRGEYFIPIATRCAPSATAQDSKLARNLWVSGVSNPEKYISILTD
ncbi:hypothetical protein N7510_008689 [Penicillium lagena]|uniref:uncharacterized protein n=1 Tax=Penicillium lagena TaxID=94218 RepID=UPI0025411ECB|nr:uncharacterized protein N7510_008689 [Penicillium lagena]KAJ5605908.1 hypothetical protein N7510_008689 [Penicillium lagena]